MVSTSSETSSGMYMDDKQEQNISVVSSSPTSSPSPSVNRNVSSMIPISTSNTVESTESVSERIIPTSPIYHRNTNSTTSAPSSSTVTTDPPSSLSPTTTIPPPPSTPPNNNTNSHPHYYSTQGSTQHSHTNHTSNWEKYIRHFQAGPYPTVTKLLFVVNFHEPRYESIPFLESTFFPAFRVRFPVDFDVVFLGPWEDKKHLVIPNHIPIHGHLSYHSLWVAYNLLCVAEQCKYFGFLFMNDDSYVDPQFLMQYDLTQSWTEGSQQIVVNRRWMWYTKKNDKGVLYKDAFSNAIKELQQSPWNERCHFENTVNHRRGMADFFYIVATDMPAYYAISFVMKKHRVFLEMAAPTVNWCLTHNKVDNCNHGPMKNRRTCVHMHTVKLRQEGMKEFMMQRLHHLNLDRAPPRMW